MKEIKKCTYCGKIHKSNVKKVFTGSGCISNLSELIKNCRKVFVLADKNTYAAAGEKVIDIIEKEKVGYSKFILSGENIEPDENAVGSVIMHYDADCDFIVGIGSGVINDIGKIVSKATGRPYAIVATAPSMDGYASATSSTLIDGFKVSVKSKAPDFIIGDTEILKTAPSKMLKSGLGDMLAKYISICEWRISHLLRGEYYCEYVAKIVRTSLKKCVINADGLLKKENAAIEAVFEGLADSGAAMEYVGLSYPASGVEHYISHIWDMRGLSKGTPVDFHGIQCAIGTLTAAKIYEQVKKIVPDKEKALKYVQNFDKNKWNEALLDFVGDGAKAMIAQEEKEKKYDIAKHSARLDKIIENWDEILRIINEEVPPASEIEKILDTIKAPKSCEEIGMDKDIMPMTFKASKDVRDKYVLSRLCWDLGIIDEIDI